MKKSFVTACAAALLWSTTAGADPATFDTPQQVFDEMVSVLKSGDRNAALALFGKEAEDFLSDGDPVEDAANRNTLLVLYKEGYRFVPQDDGSLVIALGSEGWPFPIPIAQSDGAWAFDIETGRQEVYAREIGLNELEVIELLEAYVGIQSNFRSVDQDGDGVMEFAEKIISDAEQGKNGLFWPLGNGPLGELLGRASAYGYNDGQEDREPEPYAGYYFRILTAQTDAAPGGALSYLVNGNMISGHAILAAPASFGETGVHSFMVSENGVILEAVLGEDTLEKAAAMEAYDPTDDWKPVN